MISFVRRDGIGMLKGFLKNDDEKRFFDRDNVKRSPGRIAARLIRKQKCFVGVLEQMIAATAGSVSSHPLKEMGLLSPCTPTL